MNILHTPRLTLRWAQPADAAFFVALLNDPDWHRWVNNPSVASEADALAWMRSRLFEPYWRCGHGFWVMQARDSGQPIGICGVFQRASLPAPDLGYGLLPAWRGQGLVQEAARACVAYAREVLGLTRLLGVTDAGHAASARVLAAAGLRHVDTRTLDSVGQPRPTEVYEITWPAPDGDAAAIDALVARFFAAFDNREGQPHRAAALPFHFTPDARIAVLGATGPAQVMDVRAFTEPRAALLAPGGRLTDFHEWPESSSGWQHGRPAQRRVRYAKRGRLDGAAYAGSGTKALQLRREDGRWRIAALDWQDD